MIDTTYDKFPLYVIQKKGIDAFSRRPYETYFTVLYPKASTNPGDMKYDRATSVSFSHGQLQSDFQEQR